MTAKLDKQPLCRYCGKPIAKRTDGVYVHQTQPNTLSVEKETIYENGQWVATGNVIERRISLDRYVVGTFKDQASLQRVINEKIVSVRYSEPDGERVIRFANVWDGESYMDAYFCKNQCAIDFANLYARDGHATVAYNNALKARNATQKS